MIFELTIHACSLSRSTSTRTKRLAADETLLANLIPSQTATLVSYLWAT